MRSASSFSLFFVFCFFRFRFSLFASRFLLFAFRFLFFVFLFFVFCLFLFARARTRLTRRGMCLTCQMDASQHRYARYALDVCPSAQNVSALYVCHLIHGLLLTVVYPADHTPISRPTVYCVYLHFGSWVLPSFPVPRLSFLLVWLILMRRKYRYSRLGSLSSQRGGLYNSGIGRLNAGGKAVSLVSAYQTYLLACSQKEGQNKKTKNKPKYVLEIKVNKVVVLQQKKSQRWKAGSTIPLHRVGNHRSRGTRAQRRQLAAPEPRKVRCGVFWTETEDRAIIGG